MCFDETMDRRAFFRLSSGALIASMAGGFGLPGIALAAGSGGKTLVKIFQRGGADGLYLFPPFADPAYYAARPNVKILPPNGNDATSAIRLSSTLGLHPKLRSLKEIWDDGRLGIYPATHFNEGNLSHFDCQAWIERGGTDLSLDGMFNRYLQTIPGTHPLRALVAGMGTTADSMVGDVVVPSVPSGPEFQLTNWNWCDNQGYDWSKGSCVGVNTLTKRLWELNRAGQSNPTMAATRNSQLSMMSVMDQVQRVSNNYTPSAGGLNYSESSLGKGLKLIAQLLKANVPVEVAAVDWTIGWDSHEDHLPPWRSPTDENNDYTRGLRVGADDMLCFYRDIAALRDKVMVIVGSEFGREVGENGTYGTDHGFGGAWFAFGGPTRGGVFGRPASVAKSALINERYLPSILNYKNITGEAMVRHLGMSQSAIATIFPGHRFTDHQLFTRTS
jgi:uncharacterized protein (DUF1501 family)